MILGRIDGATVRGGSQGAACDLPGHAARTAQRWRAQGIGSGRRAGPRAAPASVLSNAERRTPVGVACSEELCGVSPKRIVPILAERGVDIGLGQRSTGSLATRGSCVGAATGSQRHPARGRHGSLRPRRARCGAGTSRRCPARSAEEAAILIERTCVRDGITRELVTPRSDSGGPRQGATMRAKRKRLGVATSISRPRVSDSNP